ncbi:MAG: asparagine synthase (glutamine-hydrolyzing) [Bacteroidia bacterium]|nr:asparagine synthase (glutamine-hydrolyzing) [Bacteroidia bacterium]
MCGIAGVIMLKGEVDAPEALDRMSAAIAHRGPDGSGKWLSPGRKAAFVHRRLSILDLSEQASQPMHSSDGRYTIVFNGEIYNYLELREQLLKKGVRFVTHSDTEVLLNGYIHYKDDLLPLLDGMFAFAVWDNDSGSLFCARDRFGEKPFFYIKEEGCFLFASEIKALKAFRGRVDLDPDKLQSYLDGTYSFDDSSGFFKQVHSLEPASSLFISADHWQVKKYWRIDLSLKAPIARKEEYIEEFRRLFLGSVRFRLRSDVPVGSSLSGGLDSSAVVCSMSGLTDLPVHTFSARFEGPKDEGKWIREVLNKTGVINHEVWPSAEGFVRDLDTMVWHHEFPPGSSSVYAQWCVMKLASQNKIKVLLDGQGADEYLAGYDELKYYAVWELYRKFRWRSFNRERKLFKENFGHHGKLGYAFLLDPLAGLLGIRRKVYRNGMDLHDVLKYYTTAKLGELLRYADRNSMAHGVEVRLPFLSHKLVEFAFSVPSDMIYRDGRTKYILREAVKDSLPAAIYNRSDKIGFTPPQEKWMNEPSMVKLIESAGRNLSDLKYKKGKDSFRQLAAWMLIRKFQE